jgi:hypothetical protein
VLPTTPDLQATEERRVLHEQLMEGSTLMLDGETWTRRSKPRSNRRQARCVGGSAPTRQPGGGMGCMRCSGGTTWGGRVSWLSC